MFLYGGNDPAIESPEGKLTNDPYFAEGGLTKYQDKGEVTEDSKNNTKNTFGTDQMPDWFKEWASQNASSGYRDPYSGWDGRGSMPYITTSNAPQDWRRANPQYYPQYPVMGGYGMPSIRTKQKGMPYMSGTRQPYMGSLDNARIKSIDVKKTRAFGPYRGMPKKYTVNYQVESDPLSKRLNFTDSGLTLDGRPVGDSSQRGMSPAGKKLTDRMIDSGVRPISWLGSRLQPFGITPDKSSGIPRDKNDEAYKRIYGHYPGEGTQLDLSKELAFQVPPISEDEQYPAIPDLAQMQGYQLPTRKPMPLSSMTGTPEIIPTKYGSPQGANFGPEVPPLEEGEAGPMGEEQALEEQEAAQAQRSYGLDLLDPIASMEDYMAQSADENQLAEQDFMLQRMAMQNPDYFNQSPYNNPVFNPEEMTTGNIIDFNAPIVTPQQYVESQQRVTTYKSFKRSKASTIPAKKDTRETRVAKATQEGNVPQVSRPSRVTTPFKTTEQKQKEYQDWANSRKTEQDKFYTNIAGEEKTAMKEKELRQAQQNLKQESKSFKEKFGIDSATFNLYKTLLDNPTANKAVIDNMKKTYPSLVYLEPLIRNKSYKEGGYLPQAYVGEDTPINQDERFKPAVKSYGIQNPGLSNPFTYSGQNAFTGETSGVRMGNESSYVNEGLVSEEDLPDFSKRKVLEDVSVDYRTKRKLSNADATAMLNYFNVGANSLLNVFGERGDIGRRRQMYDQLTADALYGNTNISDRGTYETNSGLFKPDEEGFRGVARYGGMLAYDEGGETYMSEEQIRKFLEEGGELEFI